jgi:lipocalin
MIVDATGGKVDNSSRAGNDNAQVNAGTKFTIPAVSGMKIEIADANIEFSTTTIAGTTEYDGKGTKSISYTYTGTDETIDIVINEGNQYLKTIKVTYPVTAANVTIAPAKEYTTYIAPAALDFTGLDIKAYVATEATVSAITVEPVTTVPAGTALVLKKGNAASYDVPVIASATAPAKNKLKGSATASYNVEKDGDAYVLSNGAFHPVKKGKLAAGKAYILKADVPTAAPELSIVFGNLTGIQNITTAVKQSEGVVFDLQGRKVAQPAKGLYIVNGKKVVIK